MDTFERMIKDRKKQSVGNANRERRKGKTEQNPDVKNKFNKDY